MADRTFTLKFLADIQDLTKKVGNIDESVQGMKGKISGYGKSIAGMVTGAAVITFGKQIVSAASDQEQAVGALTSVFGNYTNEMDSFGKTTAQNMGISRAEFSQSAATMGALLKNAGVPMNEVAESTKGLTGRAADLAAMYGGTVPEAMDAMKSALKGEFDPMEKFGVSLKASTIEAKAQAMGLVDAKGKATDYGKAMAAQALIMEQSADAAGTFTKESGSAAGQQAILTAQFKDMQATLGKALLPVIVEITKALVVLVNFVSKNSGWLIPLTGAIVAFTLAVKGAMIIKTFMTLMKEWEIASKLATAAQWLWNAAMAANPIFLIVAAVAAVIAIVVLLYMKVDWFREAVDAAIDGVVAAFQWLWDMIKKVWQWVSDNWPLLLAILTGPIGLAVKFIVDHWDQIKQGISNVISWIRTNWQLILGIITGPFGAAIAIIIRHWDTIKQGVSNAINAIKSVVGSVASAIAQPFQNGWNMIKSAWQGAASWFSGILNGIKNVFSGMANAIKRPFEIAFNGIKNLWNSTVGRLSFTVPSWVPGIGGKGWSAPRLAKGGIVTRPTLALIGEAGPEAVVPLGASGGYGFGTTVINVYALTASAEVGRKVYEALREYDRISGKAM